MYLDILWFLPNPNPMKRFIHLAGIMTALIFCNTSIAQAYDASKNLYKQVTITWVYASDANKACRSEFQKIGARVLYTMDACAVWNGSRCKIITRVFPTEASVGHEVMHCFQGAYD